MKAENKLLVLLVLTDFLFIIAHCFYQSGGLVNPLFSIQVDFGFAEIYQYVKETWLIFLMIDLIIYHRRFTYLAWCTVFIYILVDDCLRVHERLGKKLISYYEVQPNFYLRSQDIGELLVTLIFGSLLALLVFVSYIKAPRPDKHLTHKILPYLFALVFFGVVVDMIHSALSFGKPILTVIEDGGEMLVISALLAYIFKFSIENTKSEYSQ